MKKRDHNKEMKFYELIGIKSFRNLTFKVRYFFSLPFTMSISKEERKNNNSSSINYNIESSSIKDLRKHKLWLLFNALIHLFAGITVIMNLILDIVIGNLSILSIIFFLVLFTLNTYCIILQRYVQLKLNNTIKNKEAHEEIKKEKLIEELSQKDDLANKYTYEIVNKNNEEQNITFEEVIKNASYNELLDFREYLTYLKEISILASNYDEDDLLSDPIPNNKDLKLKLKPKNKDKELN